MGKTTFRQMPEYRFFMQTAKKRKRRRFAQNASIAIRAFKAYFAKPFMFARVQDCQDSKLLELQRINIY